MGLTILLSIKKILSKFILTNSNWGVCHDNKVQILYTIKHRVTSCLRCVPPTTSVYILQKARVTEICFYLIILIFMFINVELEHRKDSNGSEWLHSVSENLKMTVHSFCKEIKALKALGWIFFCCIFLLL